MSLLSSKSHFWPAKVTSVHQFLLATTSSLSKGVKRQFCLLKRQFCPVMILTSNLANSLKKLHLSVKTLRISFHLTYAGNKSFIPRRESAKAGPKGSICFYLYIYWYSRLFDDPKILFSGGLFFFKCLRMGEDGLDTPTTQLDIKFWKKGPLSYLFLKHLAFGMI